MITLYALVPWIQETFVSVCPDCSLSPCRFSILRQRQTPLLQRLRCSALVLWHQPTRHSRQCTEEGINIINCCNVNMTGWQHYSPTSSFYLVAGDRSPVHPTSHLFLFSLQWKAEIQDFCPSTRILLIGCKTDLRTDVCTRMELSNQKQTPISHEQVCFMATLSAPVCL